MNYYEGRGQADHHKHMEIQQRGLQIGIVFRYGNMPTALTVPRTRCNVSKDHATDEDWKAMRAYVQKQLTPHTDALSCTKDNVVVEVTAYLSPTHIQGLRLCGIK